MQQVQAQEETRIISSNRETLVSVRGLVKHFPVEGTDEHLRFFCRVDSGMRQFGYEYSAVLELWV